MENDQVGRKFTGLAKADMARLPHLMHTQIVLVVCKRPSPSAGTARTLNLPCFTREIVLLRFLWIFLRPEVGIIVSCQETVRSSDFAVAVVMIGATLKITRK
jgi:hypothetical protein